MNVTASFLEPFKNYIIPILTAHINGKWYFQILIYVLKMSKQGISSGSRKVSATEKPKKLWSLGLLESMKDPKSIYKETKEVVVIKDKYPKAKIHYLVLPHDEISSIFNLNKNHVDLLEEFGKIFEEIQKEHSDSMLCSGFHAVPSMHRLHMHIISKDMISPCLKTKLHWNSFTTNFFLPYQDVLRKLKEDGHIEKISPEAHKKFMSTPLKCNQCNFEPKNMPQLKQHLVSHCD
ncbi:aprataxin [Zerene cesonia]|uniref:aprataxin n=1 Tax=Zerene cesonia TaxID=33412 RepID=UPI0018E4ED64|nr:aprataxin [Zerene cesonia]